MIKQKILLAGVLVFSAGSCLAVSEDDYLNNIDAYVDSEASKLEATQELDPGIKPVPALKVKSKAEGQQNQDEFEAFLQNRHRGTFNIYQTLSADNQLKVFQEFSAGLPIKKIRRLVIQLKLRK
jgi:hypothetical protein